MTTTEAAQIREALERWPKGFMPHLDRQPVVALTALDSLEAEIERLRAVVQRIADPSYVGNYSPEEVVSIYRKWAKQVSEGDPVVVRPSDSRAESQAGLNDPSGSPTSPSESNENERLRAVRITASPVDVEVVTGSEIVSKPFIVLDDDDSGDLPHDPPLNEMGC